VPVPEFPPGVVVTPPGVPIVIREEGVKMPPVVVAELPPPEVVPIVPPPIAPVPYVAPVYLPKQDRN